jgi:hypothetical protein
MPLDPVTRERAAHDGGRASRPPFI